MLKDLFRSVTGRKGEAQPPVPAAAAEPLREGKLVAEVVAALGADAVATLLAAPEYVAVGALVAGRTGTRTAIPAVITLLADDGLAGRAAAWALGQLTAEAELCAVIPGAKLDVRENGYRALASLAALGKASAQLATWLAGQLDAEIERTKSGGSGLGERVCRVLAVLGAPGADAAALRVIEQDRFCDRFELQRLRKAVSDGGKDRESIADLSAPWTTIFAEDLWVEPAPAPTPEPVAAPAPAAKGGKPAAQPPAAGPGDEEGLPPEGEPPAVVPLDWAAFAASPQAAALPPQIKQLAVQLGPMLEQLAARAVGAPLADLAGQEFAGLLLQVLPQALPKEHIQMALSPQAINAYQAVAKWLVASGQATHGEDLATGVKLVREQLIAQMRRTGMLGGPDYSDPDDAQPGSKKLTP